MSLQHIMFGYYRHTSLMMRADKTNRVMGTNNAMPKGLMRSVREDES